MDLKAYFENAKGTGVLATADKAGIVDAALYGRPHVMTEKTVAFIMADKRSHANLQTNPHAAYLFVEAGPGYKGTRLYLTKTEEITDQARIAELRRSSHSKCPAEEGDIQKKSFLVYFRIDNVRALAGE